MTSEWLGLPDLELTLLWTFYLLAIFRVPYYINACIDFATDQEDKLRKKTAIELNLALLRLKTYLFCLTELKPSPQI